MDELQNYQIDNRYAILKSSTSLGSQIKFYKDNYWYKYDNVGNEGLAEQMVSDLLYFSNIEDYVSYERCLINGRKGCRSLSFLKEDEQTITFNALYKNIYFSSLNEDIMKIEKYEDRFAYIVDFIKKYSGVDCTQYLYNNITLDMLTKNPDRHFDNLALIVNSKNEFRCAPIFDNGQSLLQNFTITPPYMDFEEKLERLTANTFCGNFELQFLAAQKFEVIPFQIQYDKLIFYLNRTYDNSIARDFLLYSLKQYEKLFNKDYEHEL